MNGGRRSDLDTVAAAIGQLERVKHRFTRRAGSAKLAALRVLAGRPIERVRLLLSFHEALCFLQAYPDSREVLRAVEDALGGMAAQVAALGTRGRARDREALDATGVVRTAVRCPLSFAAARWLVTRFPDRVEIDWGDPESKPSLVLLMAFVVALAEEDVLVEVDVPARAWLSAAKGDRRGSDLAWLVSRLGARADAAARAVYDARELPVRWDLGETPAARTLAKVAVARVVYQRGPLQRWRGLLGRRLPGQPVRVRRAIAREAGALLDVARAAVIVRSREAHAFNFADPGDVLVADVGRGVQVVWFGVLPPHRLPLRAHYGYLLLKNGVPVGYGDASLLFDWVEIAYNIFETFRRGESAFIFVRLLAFLYRRFGVRAFHLSPYQIGLGNDEALDSGAFWFYYKLGFRPKRADLRRLASDERRRIAREPTHRSSRAMLKRLSASGMFYALGGYRGQASRDFDVRRLALRAVTEIARRNGARPPSVLAAWVAAGLGAGDWRRWPASERAALEGLAPILAAVPDLDRWRAAERRALVAIVRAKGGPHEAEYLRLLRGHVRLRARLLSLGRRAPSRS